MSGNILPVSGGSYLDVEDLAGFIDAVLPSQIRVLAGLDSDALRDRIADGMSRPRRPMLHIDFPHSQSAELMIERAIDGLARAAANLWPFWWDGEDFSEVGGDILSVLHLPIRLSKLARKIPQLAPSWGREAVMRLIKNRLPRMRQVMPEIGSGSV